jgi:biopolymer transport protein ExbD
MKLKGAKQVHYDSGPNMTPLVDVVMVILIFLMLAGSFGSAEHFLASRTPIQQQGAANTPPPPGWEPPVDLNVRVDSNGDAMIDGMAGRIQDPEDLRRELQKRMVSYKAANTKKVQVVLKPTEGTRWESIAPLYDAALRAGYDSVAFKQTGGK